MPTPLLHYNTLTLYITQPHLTTQYPYATQLHVTRLLHNYTSASHSFSRLYSTLTVLGGTLHHTTIHIFPIAIVCSFLHISLLHKALLYCTLTTHDTTHLRQTLAKHCRTKHHVTPLHLYQTVLHPYHTTRYTSVPYLTSPLHYILYPTKPYPYFSAQNIASLHRYCAEPHVTIFYHTLPLLNEILLHHTPPLL